MQDSKRTECPRHNKRKHEHRRWGKAILWWLLKLADWLIDGVTTVLMITGIGCFAGVGFGVGLAIVVALWL